MKIFHIPPILAYLLSFFLLFVLTGCDHSSSPTTPATEVNVPLDAPAPGTLLGQVVGTIANTPLAGIAVSVGSRTTQTDTNGEFRLDDVGTEIRVVDLSGDGIYPRTTVIDVTQGSTAQLDAIEKGSGFHLGFYRELARGNHPDEGELLPLHRWTSDAPPTFYIDTNASATEKGVISESTFNEVRELIAAILPVFSGNVYTTAPTIQFRHFSQHTFDAIPENSIAISFDDTLYARGALGVTFTSPTDGAIRKAWSFVIHRPDVYRASGISRKELIAHELGHAFGFRHTTLLPSVMKKTGAYGGLFSEHDRLHMAIVYHRPAGNIDLDTDPLSTANYPGSGSKIYGFVDQRANFSHPPDVLQRLETLPSLTERFFQDPRVEFTY